MFPLENIDGAKSIMKCFELSYKFGWGHVIANRNAWLTFELKIIGLLFQDE